MGMPPIQTGVSPIGIRAVPEEIRSSPIRIGLMRSWMGGLPIAIGNAPIEMGASASRRARPSAEKMAAARGISLAPNFLELTARFSVVASRRRLNV